MADITDSGLTEAEELELSRLEAWSRTWRPQTYIEGCICAGSHPTFWGYCGCQELGTPPTPEEQAKFDRISDLATKAYYNCRYPGE